MGNRIENRAVLSTLRYKSAPETDLYFGVSLSQNVKQNTEFDRTVDINLQDVFDRERQESTNFRPSCKFSVLFKNSYSGYTSNTTLQNNLYYLNPEVIAAQSCPPSASVFWPGLPQYNEFDFIRTDYDVTGYTQPPNQHLTFIPKSATNYNWMFYMSYAHENDFTKPMRVHDRISNQTINWICGDGIPFVLTNLSTNGLGNISFRCQMNHGLSVGEFVKLSFSYNGNDLFQVDSLGDGSFGSEEYIFNIINIGFTGPTFNSGTIGTFKRVILGNNPGDSTSKYYVRRHKILTTLESAVVGKCGFEQNIFGVNKKYESRVYTPNKKSRVSIKEGANSFTLSFNEDINLKNLLDNQLRPVNELYFTVIWRGYFGWTYGATKQGWDFNLPLVNGSPSNWWTNLNSDSNTGFQINNWNSTYLYTGDFVTGDTLDGDYCEWNDYDQTERVISSMNHKIKYNPAVFNIGNSSEYGYYYKPLNSIKIRDFSPYIEEGDYANVVGIPNYSYFSTDKNLFIWRDLYPYGYIDDQGVGVNYPFFNATHYPYNNFVFRIIPEGTNYSETVINAPTTDNCE
jgi:hypothetical protein